MDGGPLHQRGPSAVIEGAPDRGTSFGVVRPPTEMNPVRPTVHRFRASHPKGRSEAEDPGGEAAGVDGRGRGGTLGMLRTDGRLTGRGLAGPSPRGSGTGARVTAAESCRAACMTKAAAPSEGITPRAPIQLTRHRGPAVPPRARRRPRRRPSSRRPRVDQPRAFTRTSRAASCTAKAAAAWVWIIARADRTDRHHDRAGPPGAR